MKRGWQRLLGVAALVSGVACGSDSSLTGPPDSVPSGSLTLSGRVSENTAEGKRPSRRARVLAGAREAETGEDGSFSIGGLPAGLVQVSVTKVGYDEVSAQVEMNANLVLDLELWRSERGTR